jgi:hypothetical protein
MFISYGILSGFVLEATASSSGLTWKMPRRAAADAGPLVPVNWLPPLISVKVSSPT